MTAQQRETAEAVVEGIHHAVLSARFGVTDRTIRNWVADPEVKALIAQLENERNTALIRAAGHNAAYGITLHCRAQRRLGREMGLHVDDDDAPEARPQIDLGKLQALQNTTALINRLLNDGDGRQTAHQNRTEQAEKHGISMRSERVALAAAIAGARASGIPTDPDDVEGEART